ncbi:MAG: hypothetical protein V4441_06655 [Pseudomonadota bacterium]
MSRPDTIVIEGRVYRWRDILEMRRQQIAAWKAARPDQPALFPLIVDSRPKADRTAAGRYKEPTLFNCLLRIMEQADGNSPTLLERTRTG